MTGSGAARNEEKKNLMRGESGGLLLVEGEEKNQQKG